MKVNEGMVDIPPDFHQEAVAQFITMMELYADGKLATVPMQNVDGAVYPAIVSTTAPQVVFGVLFVPPPLTNPHKGH